MKNRLHKPHKDMFDVSAVLLQNAFETTSPSTTLARISATPRCILSLQQEQAQYSLLFRQTVDGLYFPVFRALCCCRFYSTSWPDWFCSTSCAEISVVVVESEIHVADVRQVALLCVINFTRLELQMWHRVQNKTTLTFVINHANWFRRFEDVSGQILASRSGLAFRLILYTKGARLFRAQLWKQLTLYGPSCCMYIMDSVRDNLLAYTWCEEQQRIWSKLVQQVLVACHERERI